MSSETKKRLLLSKWRSEIEKLRDEQDRHEEQIAERDYQIEQMESVLTDVKYWMHKAQFRRSWPLLRKVEDALG